MQDLPIYVAIGFGITTLLSIYLFYRAAGRSGKFLALIFTWMAVQGIIALTGFYTVTTGFPPRILFLIGPPLLFIVLLFVLPAGRRIIDKLDIKAITLVHLVRIPVELCILAWFVYGLVPRVMTFEGRNPDILIGIAAAIIAFYNYRYKNISRTGLIIFNIAGIIFLLNIVIIAILSAPLAIQQLGFEQPNIAIFYFPFVWLPSVIVPLVLLSHLAALRKLLVNPATNSIPAKLKIEH